LNIIDGAKDLPIQSNELNDLNLVSNVKKHSYGRIDQPMPDFKYESPRFSRNKKDPYALDDNIKLVPCRWSNTGWKYVKEDPSDQQFFSSPNRVNSHGWDSKKKAKSVLRDGRNIQYQNNHTP
jgi:hypothetical protein